MHQAETVTLHKSTIPPLPHLSPLHSPSPLVAIERAPMRAALGIASPDPLPFQGLDRWNAYELSWLDERGRPVVAIARMDVPCDSPRIIESKSLKLYLHSLAQMRFASCEQVVKLIQEDMSHQAGTMVTVDVQDLDTLRAEGLAALPGVRLDDQQVRVEHYQTNPDLLTTTDAEVRETLFSHLFRCLCPVTGQPDWGSILIEYQGPRIDHAGILLYLISYRQERGFHEQMVERIFVDILRRCTPYAIKVAAWFQRRGGIDINPIRATDGGLWMQRRLARQ